MTPDEFGNKVDPLTLALRERDEALAKLEELRGRFKIGSYETPIYDRDNVRTVFVLYYRNSRGHGITVETFDTEAEARAGLEDE